MREDLAKLEIKERLTSDMVFGAKTYLPEIYEMADDISLRNFGVEFKNFVRNNVLLEYPEKLLFDDKFKSGNFVMGDLYAQVSANNISVLVYNLASANNKPTKRINMEDGSNLMFKPLATLEIKNGRRVECEVNYFVCEQKDRAIVYRENKENTNFWEVKVSNDAVMAQEIEEEASVK